VLSGREAFPIEDGLMDIPSKVKIRASARKLLLVQEYFPGDDP
jgi:hypothetical protein